MKKYLLCILNDQNYTEPGFEFYDTLEKAKENCVDNVLEHYKHYKFSKEEAMSYMEFEEKEKSYRYDYSDNDGVYEFLVHEIIEVDVNENDYLCVWHHAYNGVDFEILKVGSYEECVKAMYESADKVLNNVESTEDFRNENQVCIDTENEWEVWTIVRVEEMAQYD